MIAGKDLSKRDTQHLTTLIEDGLHHPTEKSFVATKVRHFVARHADHGTLHLGRRIEHTWLDGKEIFDIIPSLNQYRQDAILLIAWLLSHAESHFVLNHTSTTRNQVLVVEHLEEYLRRDVVGIIARQHKLLTIEHLV